MMEHAALRNCTWHGDSGRHTQIHDGHKDFDGAYCVHVACVDGIGERV